MKRRGIILFILLVTVLLVAVPTGSAEKTTKITDSWYRYIDSFSKNGNVYSLKAINAHLDDETKGVLIIKKNDAGASVNFDECVETIDYKYCFRDRTFEGDKVEIDGNGNVQPSIKVFIEEYSYSSDIKITRSFEKRKFNLFEKGQVTITVENTGDEVLSNIKLVERLPEGFSFLYYQEGMAFYNNSIFNTFTLYPDSTWETKYTLKAIDYAESSYKTQLTYDSETQQDLTASSSSTTIEVVEPYEVSITNFKKTYDRGDEVTFKLTIENNENEELEIDYLTITAPTVQSISGSAGDLRKDGLLSYSYVGDNILADEKKELVVKDDIYSIGTFRFSYKGRIKLKDKTYIIEGEAPFSVETSGLNCMLSFSDDEPTAGTPLSYNITYDNKDDETFYELEAIVTSSHLEPVTVMTSNVYGNRKRVAHTQHLIVPFTLVDDVYNFTLNASYRTRDNLSFTCQSSYSLPVNAAQRVLGLDVHADKTQARRNETVTIHTALSNLLEQMPLTNITVTSVSFPNVKGGTADVSVKQLSPQQSTNTSFEITIPETYTQEELEVLTSVVVASQTGYSEDVMTTITVSNPMVSNTTTNNNDSATEEGSGVTISKNVKKEEEKKGFIAQIIELIQEVFGG